MNKLLKKIGKPVGVLFLCLLILGCVNVKEKFELQKLAKNWLKYWNSYSWEAETGYSGIEFISKPKVTLEDGGLAGVINVSILFYRRSQGKNEYEGNEAILKINCIKGKKWTIKEVWITHLSGEMAEGILPAPKLFDRAIIKRTKILIWEEAKDPDSVVREARSKEALEVFKLFRMLK